MPRFRSRAFARWLMQGLGRPRVSAPERRRRQLETALDRLPDRRRTIVLLHRVDGLAYSDIAARLAISLEAVEAEFAAALVALASTPDD